MHFKTCVIDPGLLRAQRGIAHITKARSEIGERRKQVVDRGRTKGTGGRPRESQPGRRVLNQLDPRIGRFPRLTVMVVAATGNDGQGFPRRTFLDESAPIFYRRNKIIGGGRQIAAVQPIPDERICLVGTRDVDSLESRLLADSPGTTAGPSVPPLVSPSR